MQITEYYKSKLSESEKTLYELMYKSFKKFSFEIKADGFTMEQASKVYEALYLDHVELYYLGNEAIIEEYEIQEGNKKRIESIVKARDIYAGTKKSEITKRFTLAVDRIKTILPENPSDLDIEVAVIKYIHRICISDIDDELNQNAASCLAFGKAQCSGYAKAISLLLNKFKIKCFVATGEAMCPDFYTYIPHAWNIVKLGGKYYHLDALYGHELHTINKYMDHEYFNISDDKIKRTHRWTQEYPKCPNEEFKLFKTSIKLDNKAIKHIEFDF